MPRASIGGDISINSRKAQKELKDWEREVQQSLTRQGKMSSGAGGSGRRRSATETNQSLELMSKGLGIAKSFATSLLKADNNFEQLVRALASASDGTETLDQQIKELAKTGTLPGLNFEIAVRGALKLQTLGYSAKESRTFVEQLGNEIARTGGTTENMDGFLIQMMQTLSKGKVEMQDFKIMSEHLTGFMKTAEGLDRNNAKEFFDGLLGRLKEGQRVISGNTEAFKNLMDQWQRFQAQTSGGKIAGVAASFAEAASGLMGGKDFFGEGGVLDSFGGNLTKTFTGRGNKADPIKKYSPSDAELADRKRTAANRAKLESDRITEELRLESEKANQMVTLEHNIDEAREQGDKEKLAALEDQLDVLRNAKKVADELGISEARAADHIRRLNAHAREEESRREKMASARAMKEERGQMDIDKLRSRGKNRQADKLEKARFLDDETKRLKKQGLSETDARAMAEEKQQIKEDADYLAKHGRAKIRGGKSQNQPFGLDGQFLTGQREWADRNDTGIPGFYQNYGPGSNRKQQAAQQAAAQKNASRADGPSVMEQGINLFQQALSKLDQIRAQLLKPNAA